MAELLKQKKIRGGHRGHVKQVTGQIEAILEGDSREHRYELEQLKEALVAKIDVLKALDESIIKLMEESEEIDVTEFGQELTEASEYQLKCRKVVHLAGVELTKISSGNKVDQHVAQAAEVETITTEDNVNDSITISESMQSIEQQTTTTCPTVTGTQPRDATKERIHTCEIT
jgi:hypothetical protein